MRFLGTLWRGTKHAARWSVHNWDRLLPAIAVILMVVIFFGQRAIVDREHDAAVATCERTNEARVASIVEKRQSVKTLRKTLHFWRAALAAAPDDEPSPLLPLFLSYVDSLQEELDTKREAIRKSIEAQAEVAVRPGSPVVDCSRAT